MRKDDVEAMLCLATRSTAKPESHPYKLRVTGSVMEKRLLIAIGLYSIRVHGLWDLDTV